MPIYSKGFDQRKEYERDLAAGTADKQCYDYVRDSIETFKQTCDEKGIQDYTESIYNCGKVQQFGCFIAVHPDTRCVLACSSNAEKFLGKSWKDVMGCSIQSLFVESGKVTQCYSPLCVFACLPVFVMLHVCA